MWKATTSTYPQAWKREIKEVNTEAFKHLNCNIPKTYLPN